MVIRGGYGWLVCGGAAPRWGRWRRWVRDGSGDGCLARQSGMRTERWWWCPGGSMEGRLEMPTAVVILGDPNAGVSHRGSGLAVCAGGRRNRIGMGDSRKVRDGLSRSRGRPIGYVKE
ncbi:lysine-rich arabinogalactan protein 19-like [Iris pallida]|uniref:Lysine-rich arabinogalactan protein 19-like n=1 Tax=Iris pallida TaxID=29817 RepID=A0AAX6H4L8_IRIPA|nr:lysine-rich arabinogalactan protein 19-like [Iris pallida]